MYANIPNSGVTATITSLPMANLQKQCLTFFFLRGGTGVSLKLFKYHSTTQVTDPVVWQSNETHLVNEWIRVQQDLTITDTVNLLFQATKTG